MGLENKKFKCKDDHTLYNIDSLNEDTDYYTISWTTEMAEKETDTWRRVTVEKKLKEGVWYLVDDIARPILEERKVGKVQMDLFDSGFPNAITEVAKVMTWAAENKGYKPHDWKALPNAETEFSAAASRHRVKGFIQKAEGVAAIDRTDEESKIVHLAHTAFNILAELELVLTGKIQ